MKQGLFGYLFKPLFGAEVNLSPLFAQNFE